MKLSLITALALGAALALQACNGGSSSTPAPSLANLSGDYKGTLQDSALGSGSSSATLSQNGAAVGGTIVTTAGAKTVNAAISLTVSPNGSVLGSIVIDAPPEPSGTCTFSTSGTYDPTTSVLSGTYTAVTNCSGVTGSYTLTQQCSDTVTNPMQRRTMGVPKC
ncbi:MAG TPA: hypothetical protein VFA29_09240 [Candidatus Baltobacteraceae bacterium]|nr:hypothetical protein [Candidatus Baltobacteraceae bacterium]